MEGDGSVAAGSNQQQEAAKWTEITSLVKIVRTSRTNPASNSQLLVADKYLFKRVDRRRADLYECFTSKNHSCPSQLKLIIEPLTEKKRWFMRAHEDDDKCLEHQESGMWMECGPGYSAQQHGNYLIDKYKHVYSYVPYFKNKYDKEESFRKGQTQYQCVACDKMKIRTSPAGTYETWSERDPQTKVFTMAAHLNNHAKPNEKREEIEKLFPIPVARLDANIVLRRQTEPVEVLTELPNVVSRVGKFLATLRDDLEYLYYQIADQSYGRMKVFTCVHEKCKGMIRVIEPEGGVIRWERLRHERVNETTVGGVKQIHECREAGTRIMVPLKSGQMNFYKYTTPKERTEEEKTYMAENEDESMQIYTADRREYGRHYRCHGSTCNASLRVLVNYSHHIWERSCIRMVAGGPLIRVPHTCLADVNKDGYKLFKTETVESRLLDVTDGNILTEKKKPDSQELEDPEDEMGYDDGVEEDEEGDVSRAGVTEPEQSCSTAPNLAKRGRHEVEEAEEEEIETGPIRTRPREEFEPLFESPELYSSQESDEPKVKEVIQRESFPSRQLIQEIDKYCKYNQLEKPGERAKHWETFIKECKKLNTENRGSCNQRRLGVVNVKTSLIPGFENIIFWHERLNTVGWSTTPWKSCTKSYKCCEIECNKIARNKVVATCNDHAANRCFCIISVLCEGIDVSRVYMSYIVRAYNESLPLNWSERQAVTAFQRKKEIGLDVEAIESVLMINIKLPGAEAEEVEKESCMKMALELYSAIQVAVFLTTSFRSERLLLVRDQLNLKHIGPNFKQFLDMNGFEYQLMDEEAYKAHVNKKYKTDGEKASKNFRRNIRKARMDVHEERRGGKERSVLSRLCFKRNCKVGAHWWHTYFARFAKGRLHAGSGRGRLQKSGKGVRREDIYVGLAPVGCPSILAPCHNILPKDGTTLGQYMVEHGYTSINELDEEDYGYLFAKETEAEMRVGEGVGIFAIALLAAQEVDDVDLINKFMPVFRQFTMDDLLDLRTLMLAKFELMFYPNIAKLREGENYLVRDMSELIRNNDELALEDEEEGEEDEED